MIGSIIQIDPTPFKNWYQKHYGVTLGKATAFVKEQKQRKLKKRSEKLAAEKQAKKVSISIYYSFFPCLLYCQFDSYTIQDAIKKEAAKKAAAKREGAKKAVKGAGKKMKAVAGKKVVAVKADKVVKKETTEVKKVEKKPKAVAVTKATTEAKPKKEKKVVEGAKPKKVKKKLAKGAAHKPSGAQVKRWRVRNATRVLEAGIYSLHLFLRLVISFIFFDLKLILTRYC